MVWGQGARCSSNVRFVDRVVAFAGSCGGGGGRRVEDGQVGGASVRRHVKASGRVVVAAAES
jgi:hypothetical protein